MSPPVPPSGQSLPVQPIYLRTLNALGAAVARLGVELPSLDAQALMDHAARRTGSNDFGDSEFEQGLRVLVDDLQASAALSQVGRIVAYFNILDHLSVRLRLIAERRTRPEISQQTIEQPLFILGLPRTGTTILFELIAQDASMRSPASWEVARPVPAPTQHGFHNDPRIRSVDRLLSLMEKLAPGFRVIHALGAQLPQECVYLMASNFISEQFAYMYHVPNYRGWTLRQDMTSTYAWHAQFLQHLQLNYQAERWVLKTPAHLAHLNGLFRQYPDAAVVWTHRQPLQAVASFSSLTRTLRSGFSVAVDPVETGTQELLHNAEILRRGMQQRDALDRDQFLDVSFDAICADPLAVVESIYGYFGWTLTQQAQQAMRNYLNTRPRNLYGVHQYHPDQFGLTQEAEQSHFADYLVKYKDWCRSTA